jgi:hypothetical protein
MTFIGNIEIALNHGLTHVCNATLWPAGVVENRDFVEFDM